MSLPVVYVYYAQKGGQIVEPRADVITNKDSYYCALVIEIAW